MRFLFLLTTGITLFCLTLAKRRGFSLGNTCQSTKDCISQHCLPKCDTNYNVCVEPAWLFKRHNLDAPSCVAETLTQRIANFKSQPISQLGETCHKSKSCVSKHCIPECEGDSFRCIEMMSFYSNYNMKIPKCVEKLTAVALSNSNNVKGFRNIGETCVTSNDCFSENCVPICEDSQSILICIEHRKSFEFHNMPAPTCVDKKRSIELSNSVRKSKMDTGGKSMQDLLRPLIQDSNNGKIDSSGEKMRNRDEKAIVVPGVEAKNGILDEMVHRTIGNLGETCHGNESCASQHCIPECADDSFRCIEMVSFYSKYNMKIPKCVEKLTALALSSTSNVRGSRNIGETCAANSDCISYNCIPICEDSQSNYLCIENKKSFEFHNIPTPTCVDKERSTELINNGKESKINIGRKSTNLLLQPLKKNYNNGEMVSSRDMSGDVVEKSVAIPVTKSTDNDNIKKSKISIGRKSTNESLQSLKQNSNKGEMASSGEKFGGVIKKSVAIPVTKSKDSDNIKKSESISRKSTNGSLQPLKQNLKNIEMVSSGEKLGDVVEKSVVVPESKSTDSMLKEEVSKMIDNILDEDVLHTMGNVVSETKMKNVAFVEEVQNMAEIHKYKSDKGEDAKQKAETILKKTEKEKNLRAGIDALSANNGEPVSESHEGGVSQSDYDEDPDFRHYDLSVMGFLKFLMRPFERITHAIQGAI